MYAGATTDAIPTPTPPSTRNTISNASELIRPVPSALTKNNTAANRITISRPRRSANRPARTAPTAAPSSAEDTVNPKPVALTW